MSQIKVNTIAYFAKSISIVLGLVLIWRGMWYILDELDRVFLGGSHALSAITGLVLGFLILWLPDHNLKEITKL